MGSDDIKKLAPKKYWYLLKNSTFFHGKVRRQVFIYEIYEVLISYWFIIYIKGQIYIDNDYVLY